MDDVDRFLEEEDDAMEEQMAFLEEPDTTAAVVPVADTDTSTWVRPALPAGLSSDTDKIGAYLAP